MMCEKCGEQCKIETALTKSGVSIEVCYCEECSIVWEIDVEGMAMKTE